MYWTLWTVSSVTKKIRIYNHISVTGITSCNLASRIILRLIHVTVVDITVTHDDRNNLDFPDK